MRALPAVERTWTVDAAIRELGPVQRWEIDRGRLIVREPAGFSHGDVVVVIASALRGFVVAHDLGTVVAGEPGFWLEREPDTLRAPDVAFVGRERRRRITKPDTFAEVPPDLAVEVLSPSDRPGYVAAKVAQFLALGVRSVWVVDPRRRTLTRHLSGGDVRMYADPDHVVEDPTLPGFRCSLAELVPEPAAWA